MSNPSPVWDNLWLGASISPFPPTPVDLDVCICLPDERWFSPTSTRTIDIPITEAELLDPERRPDLEDAAARTARAVERDQKVIVRCRFGLERSALVTARALMLLTGQPPARVIEHLRTYRDPDVLDPARGDFLAWLEAS